MVSLDLTRGVCEGGVASGTRKAQLSLLIESLLPTDPDFPWLDRLLMQEPTLLGAGLDDLYHNDSASHAPKSP
jgi:hypothetical protein